MTTARNNIAAAKKHTATSLILLSGILMSPGIAEEKLSNTQKKGLFDGTITKVDGNNLTVRIPNGTDKIGRTDEKTTVIYVGFKGIGKNPTGPEVGFNINMAFNQETGDGLLKRVQYAPGMPDFKQIPNRLTMTDKELFDFVDENKNGDVDFIEYATWIFQSSKHYPSRFRSEFDKDKNDLLNQSEFTASLDRVDWWHYSRKTPEEWLSSADLDKSGELNAEELSPVIGGGHGDLDGAFKSMDKDKSGGVSVQELKPYLDRRINGKPSKDKSDE